MQRRSALTAMALGLLAARTRADSYEDFFAAIPRDDDAAITALLRRGFDPNMRDPKGQVGLTLALRAGANRAFAALLAAPRVDVQARNAEDESPLMMAAIKGHVAAVKALLARSADVNKTGWAPLHYAASAGPPHHPLLQEGPAPALKNQLALSAIDFALRVGRVDAAEKIAAAIRQRQPDRGKGRAGPASPRHHPGITPASPRARPLPPAGLACRRAYRPPRAINSLCVPCSAMRPRSITTTRSACSMVDSRCAMTSVVRPCIRRRRACCTSRSDSVSSAEVASSRIRIGASL